MKMAPLAEVKAKLSEYLQTCESEPVVITRNGKPKAVLLPVDEGADLESLVLSYSPRFRAILEKSREQARQGKVLSEEELLKALEK